MLIFSTKGRFYIMLGKPVSDISVIYPSSTIDVVMTKVTTITGEYKTIQNDIDPFKQPEEMNTTGQGIGFCWRRFKSFVIEETGSSRSIRGYVDDELTYSVNKVDDYHYSGYYPAARGDGQINVHLFKFEDGELIHIHIYNDGSWIEVHGSISGGYMQGEYVNEILDETFNNPPPPSDSMRRALSIVRGF